MDGQQICYRQPVGQSGTELHDPGAVVAVAVTVTVAHGHGQSISQTRCLAVGLHWTSLELLSRVPRRRVCVCRVRASAAVAADVSEMVVRGRRKLVALD